MQPRNVVIEFWAGPLDGVHYGWTTDEVVRLPETLIAAGEIFTGKYQGTYHLRMRANHHYIYQWQEADA